MVSYVVDISLSVTHLEKVIRGHFDIVLGIINFAFKYEPDRIEQKELRDKTCKLSFDDGSHCNFHACTKTNLFAERFYTQKVKKLILFTYRIPRASWEIK